MGSFSAQAIAETHSELGARQVCVVFDGGYTHGAGQKILISLKQLEAVQYIVQLGTFERAAAKLNTTQSAISKRVQQLETTLGLPIFDRSERGAHLTEQGESLLALAKEMLALQARMLELRSTNEMPVRLLRLGVTELSALTWLPRLITALRHRYPTVTIDPEVDMTRTLHERLLDDSIDLVVAPATFSSQDITAVPLTEVRNAWMARPDVVSPGARALSLNELTQYPIIAQGRKSGSGVFLNTWFKAQGIVFPKVLTSNSITAVVGLAVAGLGVAYLPEMCFRPLVKSRKLEIIRTKPPLPPVRYAAMYRSDRPSPFISAVVDVIREVSDFTRQLQR